ncbi:hypothetical protein [Streptomyces glaucus]|uniref:Uncharacterized protein n=1 Tax=Streptomyces glaucus TaxID=284029 RepID=A0ABN3J3X9_9ACTN
MDGSREDEARDARSELLGLCRFAAPGLARGVPREKAPADFHNGLGGLGRRGVVSLDDMARARARRAPDAREHLAQWAKGFADGYRSARAAAVPQVLDAREAAVPAAARRALAVYPDANALIRFPDRAGTVTDVAGPFTGDPSRRPSRGS